MNKINAQRNKLVFQPVIKKADIVVFGLLLICVHACMLHRVHFCFPGRGLPPPPSFTLLIDLSGSRPGS